MIKNIVKLFLCVCVFVCIAEGRAADVRDDGDNLYPVCVDGKWGYINKTGSMVIQPQFQNAYRFSGGLACVIVAGKYGFIDTSGRFVSQPQFDDAYGFSEGLAPVSKYGIWLCIDASGKMAFETEADYCWSFNDGLAVIQRAGKYGYIDRNGTVVIALQFDAAYSFSEGVALVKKGGKFSYIDKTGKTAIEPKVDNCGNFSGGLALAWVDRKAGFIDRNGNFVIKPAYDDAYSFSEGLAVVKIGAQWGYIDTTGKMVISPLSVDMVCPFKEGLAPVRVGGKWGYFDKEGKIVILPLYAAADDFRGGLASVKMKPDDINSVYIDKTEKVVWGSLADSPAVSPLMEILKANAALPEPTGLYRLEQEMMFNVLDKVVINPQIGQITLIGHYDEKYFGPRIPYLQHLAALLENSRPEFSLNWTPESEKQVDELFRRMDSIDEVKKIAYRWGQVIDDNGKITPAGRWLLPLFGVKPPQAAGGDPWADFDRYYIILNILFAANKSQAGMIVGTMGNLMRIKNPTVEQRMTALNDLISLTGNYDLHVDLNNKLMSGQISQDDAFVALHRAIFAGIERAFGLEDAPLVRVYDATLPSGGTEAAFSAAMAEMDRQMYVVLDNILQSFFARYDQIQVPPEVIEATLGVHPEVMPEYSGVAPDSQLARVMYTSDFIGKRLINYPDMQKKIPAYKTEFEFNRLNPERRGRSGASSTYHMWLSVDKLDTAQSEDGCTLETRNAAMRFNIRERDAGGKDIPPEPGSYEELLTSLYDDFAREVPVLHELRECAKMNAAAIWLRARKPDIHLPKEGQVTWNGPAQAPGVIYMTWSPRPIQGALNASMIAMGGVSLVPPVGPAVRVWPPPVDEFIPKDSSVVDMRESSMVVIPQAFDNQVLKRALRRTVDVPPPRLAGWVATASKGERTYRAISAMPVSSKMDAEEAFELQNKLQQIKNLSLQLDAVEDTINILNRKNYKREVTVAGLEKDLIQARKESCEILEDSIQALLFKIPGLMHEQGLLTNFPMLTSDVEMKNPEKIEAAYNIFKELRKSTDDEHKLNALAELFKGIVSAAKPTPALAGTFARANMIIDTADTLQRTYKMVNVASQYVDLSQKVNQAVGESESYLANMKELTVQQRELSDRLDRALKDPAIERWLKSERGE